MKKYIHLIINFLKQNKIYFIVALFIIIMLIGINIEKLEMPVLKLITDSPSNETTPTFNFTNLKKEGIVKLYFLANCNGPSQEINITATRMDIVLSSPLSTYGTLYFSAKQIDASNNESDCSKTIEYTLLGNCSEKIFAASDSSEPITDNRLSCSLPYAKNNTSFFGTCQGASNDCFFRKEGVNREKICIEIEGSCQYSCSNNVWKKINNDCRQAIITREPAIQYAKQIALGEHSCALLSDGTVKCWGRNSSNQLGATGKDTCGYRKIGYECSKIPLAVSGLTNVIQIDAGTNHTCALLNDKTVKCWGANNTEQLGDVDKENRKVPALVSGLNNVRQIALGSAHTCALLDDDPSTFDNEAGKVKCWGYNLLGQLGDGSRDSSAAPVFVSDLNNVRQISLGFSDTCALLNDDPSTPDNEAGKVKCWGFSTINFGDTPVFVSGLSNVSKIDLGDDFACVILNNKTTKCWGLNTLGELGDGSSVEVSVKPVNVFRLKNVEQIALGEITACALLSNGRVKCWGGNLMGAVGDGSTKNRKTPVLVSNLTNVNQISAGQGHMCALLNDSTVKCWGENSDKQLGVSTTIKCSKAFPCSRRPILNPAFPAKVF